MVSDGLYMKVVNVKIERNKRTLEALIVEKDREMNTEKADIKELKASKMLTNFE